IWGSTRGRWATGWSRTGGAVVRVTGRWARMSGPSWRGCVRRTRSWRWSVMCSSAASPSGSRMRWGGSRGRADCRSEGSASGAGCGLVPGAGRVPVLVLQVEGWPPAAPAGAPGPAAGRGCPPVRSAWRQVRGAADYRGPARAGWKVSENTVAALMREQGLAARRKRRRRGTTRPAKARWRAPDLVARRFLAGQLNTRWYGDGTEIRTGEGKLHLDSVLDMASRRVLGFALGEHHDARLAYGALAMAVAVRGGSVPGVIFHTDQGSEYTSGAFRAACQRLGIRQSMGRPGSALDNAVIEAWHSTLEFELRSVEHFATRAAARARVAAWIDDYNRHRRHSALRMMSPADYEQALRAGDAA